MADYVCTGCGKKIDPAVNGEVLFDKYAGIVFHMVSCAEDYVITQGRIVCADYVPAADLEKVLGKK